ncbi:uncharacterized protein LOC106153210 [Lingula anatina]|uniref:Uncharacterized protein LOC106153210 n=1 Tax=Lingula anatina TaxID=7574 RepID=A0A1S3H919_LINAN|nr:uncharacterized protein LOC106153210 [Lingula anatina]|eukprot:XP_013382508.1 uncharacterized protein LOC106153210 [Lingula anatina]
MATMPTRFSAACVLLMSLFGASISASSWFWIQPQTKFDADFILHTTHPPSESHCAGDCLAYGGCRAAYYCGNTKTCALTDSSCSSVQGGFLLSDQNCNYLQTRNRTESYLECRCQNGGTWINSTEASDSQNKCVCPVPYGGSYCDRNLTCPPQYEALFRSSCYSFNTTLTGTFDEAKAHCETMGARLVAVNDAEEHGFISQYIAADAGYLKGLIEMYNFFARKLLQ